MNKIYILSSLLLIYTTSIAQKFIVGSYTSTEKYGIRILQFEEHTNKITELVKYQISNASFLTYSSVHKILYGVSENEGKQAGVVAYKVGKDFSKLIKIGFVSINGVHPCHVALNKEENLLFISNYTSGNLLVYKLDKQGNIGTLVKNILYPGVGFNSERQGKSHVHSVVSSPNQNVFGVANLGLDKIYFYDYDTDKNSIIPDAFPFYKLADGTGPRHFVFNKSEDKIYILGELNGTVEVAQKNKNGFTLFQTILSDTTNVHTLKGSADIHFDKDQNFLYTSNRITSNSLTVFKVDEQGKLKYIQNKNVGIHPRNFNFSPNQKLIFVACKDAGAIEIYPRDITSGMLGDKISSFNIPNPVFVKFFEY